jgi:hypothetical protein
MKLNFINIFLSTLFLVNAQDLQGKCILCKDRFLTCKLNCVTPHQNNQNFAWHETDQKIQDCINTCSEVKKNCIDTSEALDCYKCALTCSTTFSDEITLCLEKISSINKASYNQNLDVCSNKAGYKMNLCMEECYGDDMYLGWTPETEANVPLEKRRLQRFRIPNPDN